MDDRACGPARRPVRGRASAQKRPRDRAGGRSPAPHGRDIGTEQRRAGGREGTISRNIFLHLAAWATGP